MTDADTLLRPPFANPPVDLQRVFRSLLAALAEPGRTLPLPLAVAPGPIHPALAAVAATLLDDSTTVWVGEAAAGSPAARWLAFHTGARTVADPDDADFVIAAHPDDLPPLASLRHGTLESPERSAVVVVALDDRAADARRLGDAPRAANARDDAASDGDASGNDVRYRLSGPGIETEREIALPTAAGILDERGRLEHPFPLGIDCFFVTAAPAEVVGLPRTTRVELAAGRR